MSFAARRKKLCALIHEAKADALLVTNFTNVTYLTGFTGDDSYLLLGRRDTIVVSDSRYETQLQEECPDLKAHIRIQGTKMLEVTADVVRLAKVRRLAVEGDALSV